ncbi:MAG TPA: type I DNA topoisomerase [Candidatus Angelobacter sp.]|nr:type I DNA topoisomerase [Candidatus Angelobacter sp.]
MPTNLIIVESPSKARTLAKFLGSGYTIKASMGHVRDLPKSKLGVDVENGFEPQYEVIKGKETQIKELRKAAKDATNVYLAADPDREGEAIAWHVAQALGLRDPDRIVFHEITRGAVEAAMSQPRKIDRDLVSAQEARRVIDRLVGYRLSPLLWRKVRTGLSAGRVQSVAVRLVVDRENEIEAFVAKESWTIDAILTKDGDTVTARLYAQRKDSNKLELGTEAEALEVIRRLGVDENGKPSASTPQFRVTAIEAKEVTRQAPLPYTTSTLQQDASTRLRFPPKRTMSIAQELYEGVDVGDGPTGLITYMRTDSTRISDVARDATAAHITSQFGKEYVRKGAPRAAKANPNANVQDAHEAIRPTDVGRTPEQISKHLTPQQARLYELIWRRFVASQMSAARFDTTRVDMEAGDYVFRANGSVLRFDGFTRVWRRDDDKDDRSLPALQQDDLLTATELKREQHFTQPPPRFTEASLIKELEERGIGRPSTYAPTIEVIETRKYVEQLERRLHPTELGKTVDTLLRQHFPDIVDVAFTADMEKRLDGIEEGTRQYVPTIDEWYAPFARTIATAETTMERVKVPAKSTGETCPECEQGELVEREGKYGKFVGCSRYPECKYIKGKDQSAPVAIGEMCPQCGKELVVRQGRRGPFVGCSGYPSCKYIKGDVQVIPATEGDPATGDGAAAARIVQVVQEDLGTCPNCGKPLARRSSRRGPFIGCTGYPSCKYIQPRAEGVASTEGGAAPASTRPAPEATGEECPDCGKPLVKRQGRFGPFVSCSGYPKCKYRPPKGATAPAEEPVGSPS